MGSSNVFSTVSFEARNRIVRGEMNVIDQTFKAALMINTFNFNPATHTTYAAVQASEHPGAHGYTTGGQTLIVANTTQSNVSGQLTVAFNPAQWTATGGNIGPVIGAIVYNDTVPDKPVLGFINLGQAWTQNDGGTLVISGVSVVVQ